MGIKQWNLPEIRDEDVRQLMESTGYPGVLCRILCARGIGDKTRVQALVSEAGTLSDPFLLKDMDAAVFRVRLAAERGERIAVYGDYDCDGITAAALLTGYLQTVGADVIYYLPNREREGYGMNMPAVDFLHSQNAGLIITVDNGISAHSEIEYAKTLGIDVVVTDHHAPRDTLPNAAAVVNPHRKDCPSGLTELAGVGVAFKLICALENDLSGAEMLEYYSDLVMIGTIADVVPLTGENRIIVRHGLDRLPETERAGLNALIERCGLEGKALSAETVAFTLVPRINAAGRMSSADDAVDMLLTDDMRYAKEIAELIDGHNARRKNAEESIMAEIDGLLAGNPDLQRQRLLIVSGEAWPHGVVGIVASRLAEKTGKPCIVFSAGESLARGSGRSLPGFSLIEAVAACSGSLMQYGGHPMAAGMTLHREDLARFTREMLEYARQKYPQMPRPSLNVDCVLSPSELTAGNIASLSALEPFGAGNKPPLFLLRELAIERISPAGEGAKHIRIAFLAQGASFTAVYFRMSEKEFPYIPGDRVDIVADISLASYNGKRQLSIIIRDLRRSGIRQDSLIHDHEIYASHLRAEYDGFSHKAGLLPDREDIAVVYRYLRKARGFKHDPTTLYYRLADSGVSYAKTLVALDVLEELGLISSAGKDGISCLPDPPRVELEASAILAVLKS